MCSSDLAVLRWVVDLARGLGLAVVDAIASPILGPEGNREFLLHLRVPSAGPLDAGAAGAEEMAGLDARLVALAEGAA